MAAQAAQSGSAAYEHEIAQTLHTLDSVPETSLISLTGLGLRDVRAIKRKVAEIFPASNLPAFLLQGLMQLEGRSLNPERVVADLTVLFRGTKQLGLFSTFLAAPAALLYGYQQLLALAGKDVASAFPDGPWQFYTQFGLREDAARHCIESVGFQQAAPQASEVDAAVSWLYAAMQVILSYDDLLANEWHERIWLRAIDLAVEAQAASQIGRSLPRRAAERTQAIAERALLLRQEYGLTGIAASWAAKRPYAAPSELPPDAYPAYRAQRFQTFLAQFLSRLPTALRAQAQAIHQERATQDLPAFQEQLSLLMMLRPEPYQELREPLTLDAARVALARGGRYYLFGVCARDDEGRLLVFPADGGNSPIAMQLLRDGKGGWHDRYGRALRVDRRGRIWAGDDQIGRARAPSLEQLKFQVEGILNQALPPSDPEFAPDLLLAQAPRSRQRKLRELLGAGQAAAASLRQAPIILSWDGRSSALPLAELRHTRRGLGDHALTIIRGDESTVFDLSHIFFDGGWGAALAEILSGIAARVYPEVQALRASPGRLPEPLTIGATGPFLGAARAAVASAAIEVAAESDAIDLAALNRLRRRMARLELELTVNDMLLLARCCHAASYRVDRPGSSALPALDMIGRLPEGTQLRTQVEQAIAQDQALNPALLIPMDAGAIDPRLRLFPATFRNPLTALPGRIERCRQLLQQRRGDSTAARRFAQERQDLYVDLRTFGALLRTLRQVTVRGESFSTSALRLLGHLPGPLQNLVAQIPQKFDVLNEIIKGREVFSNIGQMAPGSSLTRFASSRDDGETKLLVWGVMTDSAGCMRVTLRDFRPHVAALHAADASHLARALAVDYLDAYAACANEIVRSLQLILTHKSDG